MFDKSIAAKPPTVDYKDIMESDGVAEWTRQIVRMPGSTSHH
jgi:trimethyllysine dioxygenase